MMKVVEGYVNIFINYNKYNNGTKFEYCEY